VIENMPDAFNMDAVKGIVASSMKWLGRLRHKNQPICANGHPIDPPILAFYWEGGEPTGHPVQRIGDSGAFIATPDRWRIGTILALTIQQKHPGADAADSVSLQCRIVQHTNDGIEVRFMSLSRSGRNALELFLSKAANRIRQATAGTNAGQSLIEYALIVPVVFFLIVNAVDFGGFIYAWVAVANAARTATDYAVMSGSSAGISASATGAQITSLFNSDVAALPNVTSTNPAILICKFNNGTVTKLAGTATCGTAPSDSEIIATGSTFTYVTYSIDVTYSYRPFIPVFSFPFMSIPFTNPTSIHRQTVMRLE
jgi:Flp pilus assembly protein TadG